MFPFESKSMDTGYVVSKALDFAGTLYISKVCDDSIYFHTAFCFSSVNQILPFPSGFRAHTWEKSKWFRRDFQTGIGTSLAKAFCRMLYAPRVPFSVDTYHTLPSSTAMPKGISQVFGSLYSLIYSSELTSALRPQNVV